MGPADSAQSDEGGDHNHDVLCTGRAGPIVDRPVVVGPVRRETPDGNFERGEKIRECGGVIPAARCEFGRHNEPLRAETLLRWDPRGNRILAQPDRDVPAAPEATLVLPPVPDSVLWVPTVTEQNRTLRAALGAA